VHAVLVADDLTTAATRPHDRVVVLDEVRSVSAEALARAASVLDRHSSVATVFVSTELSVREGVERGDRWLRRAAAHGPDRVGGSCALMRHSVFDAANLQGLSTRHGELSLWLRAAALADVAHVREPMPTVSTADTCAGAARTGQVNELHERAHAFRELLDGFQPLRGAARLRSTAYRALARSARARSWVAAYEGDHVEASLCRHLACDVDRWRRR
jgi:hypothetical protein